MPSTRHTRWPIAGLCVALIALPAAAQWTRLSGPVPPQTAGFVQHGDLWFLGTDFADSGDLFVSSDQGHTWTDSSLPNGGVSAMLSHGGRIFVGGYLSGLFWSDDDGESWTAAGPPLSNGTVEQILPVDATSMIAGLDPFFPSLLYRSSDHGVTWTAIDAGPSLRCYDLALVDGTVLAAGEDAGVWRSPDGGMTWLPGNAGLPASADTYRFAVDGSVVFVAAGTNVTRVAVYRSDDQGASWTEVSTNLPADVGQKASQLSFLDGDLHLGVWGTFGTRGLFRSTDLGVTWTHLTANLPGDPSVMAADIIDGDLVAGSFDGAFRSGDGGATWVETWLGAAGVGGGKAILHAAGRLHVGLAGTSSNRQGILTTADLGLTWQSADHPGASTTAVDFLHHDGAIYAALYGQERGVAVSHDGGDSYVMSDAGMNPGTVLWCIHAHDGVMFAGAFEGLYRSFDDGASWSLDPTTGWVSDLTSHDGFVWASLYPGGVIRSDDDGATWTAVNAGMESAPHVNVLEVFDGTIYAGVNVGAVMRWNGSAWEDTGADSSYDLFAVGGVLFNGRWQGTVEWTDDGATWHDFSENYTGNTIEGLGATDTHLILGSRGRGFWARPLSDLPVTTATEDVPVVSAWRLDVAPNPFNPLTTVSFDLPRAGHVTVDVYDMAGRRVRRLVDGSRESGRHAVRWNGRDDAGRGVAAGVYLVRASANGLEAMARAVLVR